MQDPEIAAPLECLRIAALREAHPVAHFIDREVIVLGAPQVERMEQIAEVSRTMLKQGRDNLDRVGSRHHGFHRIDWPMNATAHRKRPANDGRKDRQPSQPQP
jgi:hypothetical protein